MPDKVRPVPALLSAGSLLLAFQSAFADDVTLSCVVDEAAPKHGRLNWEIRFDQRSQLVYIGSNVITAAITDARIDFRVDLGTGVPMTFAIDRATGAIGVTGSRGVLYNGQCKTADPSHPAP
jgi:hypothetical protein